MRPAARFSAISSNRECVEFVSILLRKISASFSKLQQLQFARRAQSHPNELSSPKLHQKVVHSLCVPGVISLFPQLERPFSRGRINETEQRFGRTLEVAMKKRKSALREPILKAVTSASTDPRTGLKVAVTEHRRGILSVKTRHYDMTNIAAMHGGGPKQELESLREHLRNQLERQKLPTDRSTHWVKSKSKWSPQTCTSPRRGERHALWILQLGI